MSLEIRGFRESDGEILEQILIENDQFEYPEVEDKASMKRVATCPAAVFLVAVWNGQVSGFAKGFYDGSRSQIQLVSVTKSLHSQGIGRALINELTTRLHQMGALTVAVVNREKTTEYWEQNGFSRLPVHVMVKTV